MDSIYQKAGIFPYGFYYKLLLITRVSTGENGTRKEKMKRHYLAAILAVMCIFMSHAIVELDEAHFPDPNFRKFITQKTKVKEGLYPIIFDDVIANQKVWYLDGLGIKDLTGIEYFTSLTYLSCDNNLLTSLDVSKLTQLESLSCMNNYLSSLDVTHNTKLYFLGCESNNLFDLDVSKCPDLQTLYLRNNHLIQLDLSKINGNNGLEG